MTSPSDPREDRKSLHLAQQSIVQAYADLAELLQLPEKDALPLPGDPDAPVPPPRRTTAAVAPPRASAAAKGRSTQSRWWLSAAAAVLVLGVVGARFVFAPSRELPTELLGRWTTSHPQFSGREMIFSPDSLELRLVLVPPTRHRIEAISRKVVDGATRLTIAYEDAGGLQRLELVMPKGREAEFSLARPKDVVWRRGSPRS